MTDADKPAILVLGATGMLGNTALRSFALSANYRVYGTARTDRLLHYLPEKLRDNIIVGVDVEDVDNLLKVFGRVRPAIVINCVGIIKQLSTATEALSSIPINSLLPHRLAALCAVASARLIHISTDCVFSGARGGYVESDPADAQDLYGRTKHMGEVDYDNAITLRTSIIGHELGSSVGLVGWFLSSKGQVNGYRRAIFSGVPTIELTEIIRTHVIPRPQLRGVYHVAAQPINKYDLLQMVAKTYEKEIEIIPDERLVIDRSLNADRFHAATGYQPPTWSSLIEKMHAFG
ncbi:dTDP-4-dehydrorhamnose reductase family protein [Bradyrhizobium barranii]|uniref:dTDP-4-dehydrorhamnose reductase family protein n=1 Tax=Bradyrhizobium barranii TaxID=2992140 RepID=UPI004033C49A